MNDFAEKFSPTMHHWYMACEHSDDLYNGDQAHPPYREWWDSLSAKERAHFETILQQHEEEREENLRERIAEAEEHRRRDWIDHLSAMGMPVRATKAIVGGQLRETKAIEEGRAFAGENAKSILVFIGPVGVGKTWGAAVAFAGLYEPQILNPKPLTADNLHHDGLIPFSNTTGWTRLGMFMTSHELQRVSLFDEERVRKIETTNVLAIDDLGVEYADAKGVFCSRLDGIINARVAAQKPTIVTTNLPTDAFKSRYGERIADRIREVGIVVGLAGKSMRRAP